MQPTSNPPTAYGLMKSHKLHTRRIALLEMEDAEKWSGCSEIIWRDALEQDGDVWELFQCHAHQYPSPSTVAAYDFLILTGSHYSAYEDVRWIRELEALLPLYVEAGVRILACCFGHQLLAKALGGTVSTNPSGRFVLIVEDVRINAAAFDATGLSAPLAQLLAESQSAAPTVQQQQAHPRAPSDQQQQQQPKHCNGTHVNPATSAAAGGAQLPPGTSSPAQESSSPVPQPSAPAKSVPAGASEHVPSGSGETSLPCFQGGSSGSCLPSPLPTSQCLRLLESHGDQVTALPRGARLLASSVTAKHELWSFGDNVLAFQFHPEMSCQVAHAKIWKADAIQKKMGPTELAASEASLLQGSDDAPVFLHLLHHFVTHGLRPDPHPPPSSVHNPAQHTTPPAPAPSGNAGDTPPCAAAALEQAGTGQGSTHRVGSGCDGATASGTAAGGTGHARDSLERSGVRVVGEQQGSDQEGPRGQRLEELRVATGRLVDGVRDAFDAGLQSCSLEYRLLTDMNSTAAAKYGEMADVAVAVAAFSSRLGDQSSPVQAALDDLGELESRLDGLMHVVDALDVASLELAGDMGGGTMGGVLAGLADMVWAGTTGRK
ncbi:MAG: hypothetical protein WDW38_003480 [Sanguina aurantia]